MSESHSLIYQLVKGWCFHMRIAQGTNRVKALLVGTIPQDVGAPIHSCFTHLNLIELVLACRAIDQHNKSIAMTLKIRAIGRVTSGQ